MKCTMPVFYVCTRHGVYTCPSHLTLSHIACPVKPCADRPSTRVCGEPIQHLGFWPPMLTNGAPKAGVIQQPNRRLRLMQALPKEEDLKEVQFSDE